MGWNVPDDWGSYYYKCSYCGGRYHASEGGCGCLDDHEQCHGCKGGRFFRGSDNRYADEGWHHIDGLTEVGDKFFCEEHLVCECCDTEKDENKLEWNTDADMLLCPACVDEEHYCAKDGPLLDHIAEVTG